MQLEAEGFRVLGAASAESALLLAVQQPLSLITLDILLPEMDGWEFLARIRQEPALQRVPVVRMELLILSLPLSEPMRSADEARMGMSFATGLPRFVMTIPSSSTRSRIDRHCSLNWVAGTCFMDAC